MYHTIYWFSVANLTEKISMTIKKGLNIDASLVNFIPYDHFCNIFGAVCALLKSLIDEQTGKNEQVQIK
jgi:hypothetical protein